MGGGNAHFLNKNGSLNQLIIDGELMNVLHNEFNVKYLDKTQTLNDIIIYECTIIASPITKNKESIAIHWFDQSWVKSNNILNKAKNYFKTNFPKCYHLLYNFIK